MARPRIILDEPKIVELAAKGYIMQEIATFMGVSDDTLTRNYADAIKRGHRLRDGGLRAKQVEEAMKGNPTMLIWLGKNLLNQSDRRDYTLETREVSFDGLSTPDITITAVN